MRHHDLQCPRRTVVSGRGCLLVPFGGRAGKQAVSERAAMKMRSVWRGHPTSPRVGLLYSTSVLYSRKSCFSGGTIHTPAPTARDTFAIARSHAHTHDHLQHACTRRVVNRNQHEQLYAEYMNRPRDRARRQTHRFISVVHAVLLSSWSISNASSEHGALYPGS